MSRPKSNVTRIKKEWRIRRRGVLEFNRKKGEKWKKLGAKKLMLGVRDKKQEKFKGSG